MLKTTNIRQLLSGHVFFRICLGNPGELCGRSLQQADNLGAQFFHRRNACQAFDVVNGQNARAHRAADNHQLFVTFCKFNTSFAGRNRIVRKSDCGRAGKLFRQIGKSCIFQSQTSDAVFGYFEPCSGFADVVSQFGNLGHGQPFVVGNNHDFGLFKQLLEFCEQLCFFVTIHFSISKYNAFKLQRRCLYNYSPCGRIRKSLGFICPGEKNDYKKSCLLRLRRKLRFGQHEKQTCPDKPPAVLDRKNKACALLPCRHT